jgi:hypothetical protein
MASPYVTVRGLDNIYEAMKGRTAKRLTFSWGIANWERLFFGERITGDAVHRSQKFTERSSALTAGIGGYIAALNKITEATGQPMFDSRMR